jgi:hypothetical protein
VPRKFVIPTEGARLFRARVSGAPGSAVEAPWLDLTVTHLDGINADLSNAPTKNKNPAGIKMPAGSIFFTSQLSYFNT